MPFADLREFIAALEANGEIQRIEEEVDWNLEASAVLRRSYEAGLPTPLFEKIKGYPAGYRLFSGGVSNFRRVAIALGVDPNTPPRQLIEEYLKRRRKPIKPEFVTKASCKENIHLGDAADLLEFPIPLIHEGDGGRYIGTWHMTVSKDPDTEWVNWGMYRHMVHDSRTMGVHWGGPTQHQASVYARSYESKNKPMEVAVVIGADPVLPLCALTEVPYGVSEADVAGGIRGEPVQLVKCETIDLAVPASAEIVIEGELRPGERKDEGPFGEYTGYMASGRRPKPVIHVKAITHRNNPIFTFCSQGAPITDSCFSSITFAAEVLDGLRAQGLPVTGVSMPPEASNMLTVIAVKKLYSGVVSEVALATWGTKRGRRMPYLIIVEDDVDPFDMPKVLHALITRCHPSKGIVRLENTNTSPLMPFLDARERKYGMGPRAYFDCTWPLDWKPEDVPQMASFGAMYSPEIQQKALEVWRKYGH